MSALIKMSQPQLDAWNAEYPPGSPCVLVREKGQPIQTRTRGAAWLNYLERGYGLAFVRVDGMSGGWSISRLSMLKSDDLAASEDAPTYSPDSIRRTIELLLDFRNDCIRSGAIDSATVLSTAIPMLQQYLGMRLERGGKM